MARPSWKQVGQLDTVYYGPTRRQERSAAVLAANGIECELLTPEQARPRWPQIAFDTNVLWRSGVGVIDAENTVAALVHVAMARGSCRQSGNAYVLRSADGGETAAENVFGSTMSAIRRRSGAWQAASP